MVAGLFTQFLLLTWKNSLLQRRKICVTVFEIVLPLVFPIVLIVIRNLSDFKPQLQNATIYETQPIGFEYGGYNDVLYAPNTTLITRVMNNTRQILKGNFNNTFFTSLNIISFAMSWYLYYHVSLHKGNELLFLVKTNFKKNIKFYFF